MCLKQPGIFRVTGLVLLAVVFMWVGACSDDNGSDPVPTPECAISGVNTSQQDSWLSGDTVNIRWTQNGVPGTVVIELLKAGSPVATIAPAAANSGFFPWLATTAGQANGSDFSIRVTGTGTGGCTGEVNGLTIVDVNGCGLVFTVVPDTITAGEDFEITWTGTHTSGLVDIALYTSGTGNQLDEKVGDIAVDESDDGSFIWSVDSFNNGTYSFYRYVIRDSRVDGCEAVSPQFRMIDDVICSTAITGPSDIPLNIGDHLLIQMEQENGSGMVNLRLYTGDVFVRGGVIADNVSVLDDYTWEVTDFGNTGDNAKYNIRSIDVVDPYCIDKTTHFTINR